MGLGVIYKTTVICFSGGICEVYNLLKGVPPNFFKIMRKASERKSMMSATIDVSSKVLSAFC